MLATTFDYLFSGLRQGLDAPSMGMLQDTPVTPVSGFRQPAKAAHAVTTSACIVPQASTLHKALVTDIAPEPWPFVAEYL